MKQDVEVRHCRVLVAVADQGSLVRAARLLGIAQSTASEALMSLERATGARILLRTPGMRTSLTDDARLLLPYARDLIAASDGALGAIAGRRTRPFRIGSVESVSSYLLPSALSELSQIAQPFEYDVTVGICEDLRRLVTEGALDVAFGLQLGSSSPPHRTLLLSTVGACDIGLIVAPDNDAALAARSARDVSRLPMLLPDAKGALRDAVAAWLSLSPDDFLASSAGSIDGVKRGVVASGAVGVLPYYAVRAEVERRELSILSLTDDFPAMRLEAASPAPDLAHPLADALLAILRRDVRGDVAS